MFPEAHPRAVRETIMIFVNLPLRYVAEDDSWLTRFIEAARPWPEGPVLAPELGLDAGVMRRQPRSWFKDVAARLRDAGLGCSIHLPFMELHPGSQDDYILSATRCRLVEALECSRLFAPCHLVGHPKFDPDVHGADPRGWLERCRETWALALDAWPDHPPLFLENTHELDPAPLDELVASLVQRKVSICFDIGHWHTFAQGCRRDDLDRWLDAFGPLVGHLHLHDNDGSFDQHRALGHGGIDLAAFFAALDARGITPSATLEPHTEPDFAGCLDFISRNRERFQGFSRAVGQRR